jgi:hypothetical protein
MEKKNYRGEEEEEMLACAVMDREASILLLHPVSANVGEQARTSAAPSRSRCGSSGAPARRSGCRCNTPEFACFPLCDFLKILKLFV